VQAVQTKLEPEPRNMLLAPGRLLSPSYFGLNIVSDADERSF